MNPNSRSRPIAGWVFTILGGLGGLLCLILLMATWFVNHRVCSSIEALRQQATSITQLIQTGSDATTERLTDLQQATTDLQQSIEEGVTRFGEQITGNPNAVAELETRLQPLREWLALALAIGQLLEITEQVVGELMIQFRSDTSSLDDSVATLMDARNQITAASDSMDQLQLSIASLRSGIPTEDRAGKLESTFESIDTKLESLAGTSRNLSASANKIEISLADFANRAKWRIRLVAILATFFLVWQAAAQYSLARTGWHLRRRSSSNDAD